MAPKKTTPLEAPGVHPSHQDRSRKTSLRIVRSVARLLERKPFEDISVAEIAKSAGISVGGFYARFSSKESLLHWFDENLLSEELALRKGQFDSKKWENDSLESLIHKYLEMVASFMRRYRRVLARITLELRAGKDPEFLERARKFNDRVQSPLFQILLGRRDEYSHADPEFAVRFGLMLASAALREEILFGERELHGVAAEDARLVDELTRVYSLYLGMRIRSNT